MLFASALALPLVVASTNTASADAGRPANVGGAVTYPVHLHSGNLLTRARQGHGAEVHAYQPLSRTWS
jgi:hypothetical protein